MLSRLNFANYPTRGTQYDTMKRITPKRDKIADILEDIKASNTFLTVENGKLRYIMRSTDDLKDFGYLDDSRRRAQSTTNVSFQSLT